MTTRRRRRRVIIILTTGTSRITELSNHRYMKLTIQFPSSPVSKLQDTAPVSEDTLSSETIEAIQAALRTQDFATAATHLTITALETGSALECFLEQGVGEIVFISDGQPALVEQGISEYFYAEAQTTALCNLAYADGIAPTE